LVSLAFPVGDFGFEQFAVVDAAVEAPAAQDADFDFDHVEPACVLWRVAELAPALFAYEATNALAKRVKRGQLGLEMAKERLASLLENGPALENDVAVNLRALEIMERFSLPSAYDAHYLGLAESYQCECWTADERLWNTVKRELTWVHWVGQQAATTEA
jgi:predicted nucleic acid-binding protein